MVLPTNRLGVYRETVFYEKVKTEDLTISVLKNCLRLSNSKDPCIIETKEYFGYQYGDKATVFINKINGQIYAEEDTRESRNQALFLIKILHRFNLVLGYCRKQEHVEQPIDGWRE